LRFEFLNHFDMDSLIKRVIYNIPGAFELKKAEPIPTPVGIEIENEGNDIVYLGSALDKWSMRGDRINIFKDLNIAIKQAKHEQTSNAN
jgi:hypothetical protein